MGLGCCAASAEQELQYGTPFIPESLFPQEHRVWASALPQVHKLPGFMSQLALAVLRAEGPVCLAEL